MIQPNTAVMPGLVPGIHVFRTMTGEAMLEAIESETWMAGTSPAMASV
jgi:hypothetical protein